MAAGANVSSLSSIMRGWARFSSRELRRPWRILLGMLAILVAVFSLFARQPGVVPLGPSRRLAVAWLGAVVVHWWEMTVSWDLYSWTANARRNGLCWVGRHLLVIVAGRVDVLSGRWSGRGTGMMGRKGQLTRRGVMFLILDLRLWIEGADYMSGPCQ